MILLDTSKATCQMLRQMVIGPEARASERRGPRLRPKSTQEVGRVTNADRQTPVVPRNVEPG